MSRTSNVSLCNLPCHCAMPYPAVNCCVTHLHDAPNDLQSRPHNLKESARRSKRQILNMKDALEIDPSAKEIQAELCASVTQLNDSDNDNNTLREGQPASVTQPGPTDLSEGDITPRKRVCSGCCALHSWQGV